ncbi:MAG: shikimate dehydrogenase [Actinomycetota bacterium]
MGARVGGSTRTVGIVGWPVSHSLSPAIHNAAFAALGLDWVYVALPVHPLRLLAALTGLRALGFAGANVTMPHKAAVAGLIDDLSEDARRLHAVNTLVSDGEHLRGENTDAPGFERFLRMDAGFDPSGRAALIFGAGGAGRACALALARGGASSLTVAAREPARVADVAAAIEGLGTTVRAVAFDAAVNVHADLIVNATPLGVRQESLPVPPVGPDTLVVDLLYHPAVTPLQVQARAQGAAAFGGIGLLLHQAALSFELWTGQQPPLEVMSAAALAAMSDRD